MTKLIPIKIRDRDRTSLLLPDGKNALYVSNGEALIVAVEPLAEGLYAHTGPSTMVARIDSDDERILTNLYRKLNRISAYELLTRHYDESECAYIV